MAGPELIPPQLPKLPEALPTPYDAALHSIDVALREYRELRRSYQRAAKNLIDHDAEVRQLERLQRKLAERQVSLTERVKRRLVREYSARENHPAESLGETTAELAQRLLTERHARESTQASATPAPQTRSRFSVMSMIPGTVRASRLSRAQPRSEHAFASLLDTRRTAADTDGRLNELNGRSESLLAGTQRSFSNAADAFANLEAVLSQVDRTLPDFSNTDRRILSKLDGVVASARIGVTAGQEVIDAHRRAQRDDRTLTRSSQRSAARVATPEPTVHPEFNELQYPSVRESMPVFMQMPTPAQCMVAAVNVTPQTSLTQDANIASGTARQRVDGLEHSLAGYHENVAVLRQHLRENVLAIQAYVAQPGEGTMSAVEDTRLSLETHLYSVRDAVGDVSKRCADVRQIQDPLTLGFALRVAETAGRIDATLDREIDRNRTNKFDVRTFDERYRNMPTQVPERHIRELQYPGVTAAMPLFKLMPGKLACLAGTNQIVERTLLKPDASNMDRTPPQRVERLADALEGYATQLQILESRLSGNEAATREYDDRPRRSTLVAVMNSRLNVEKQIEAVSDACKHVRREWRAFKQIEGTESMQFTQYMKHVLGRIDFQLDREVDREVDRHNPARLDLGKFDDEFRKQREQRQEQRDVLAPSASRLRRAPLRPSRLRNEIVEHQEAPVVAHSKPVRR